MDEESQPLRQKRAGKRDANETEPDRHHQALLGLSICTLLSVLAILGMVAFLVHLGVVGFYVRNWPWRSESPQWLNMDQAPASSLGAGKRGDMQCIDDSIKQFVLSEFKKVDPDAGISQEWSQPGQTLLLAHELLPGRKMVINGWVCPLALCNKALFEMGCTDDGQWILMYETMLPDIPGERGGASTSEVYRHELDKAGLSIDGDHYHWKGTDHAMHAIHHKQLGGAWHAFVANTVQALKVAQAALHSRGM